VCTETGAPLKVGGPIWLGPLHDQDVLQNALQRLKGLTERSGTITKKIPQHENQPKVEASTMHEASSSSATKSLEYIATKDRLHGLLTSCLDELPDVPLYYMLDIISSSVNIPVPPIFEIKSALVNAGYRVSGHHREPLAIKTDAPPSVLWDVMRGWVKRRPMAKPPTAGSLAETIFSVEPSFEVNFSRPWTIQQTKDKFANAKRFPGNPERNWGPKPKAVHGQKRKSTEDEEE
jgi:tRNA (guanine26-N2/guanine27-N2)-dimethyltransferase